MDEIVKNIAGLGVPGLVLLVVMAVSGYTGAVAITTSLALLGGPFGMLGGIAVLGILALISQGLANYGLEKIFQGVVDELVSRGKSKERIAKEISSYPISRELKLKIKEYLGKTK